MFDALVRELSERYGLGDRGRDLFGLLLAYIHNDRRGGFGGFVEGFREQGHGELLSSWLGNPEAGGLNASDVGTVFGQGLLNDWGSRLGVSRATVAAAIAGVLPRLVAELTPGGRIPGGFAPVAPHDPAPAAPRTQRYTAPERDPAYDDPHSYRARPGVDGLVGGDIPPAPAAMPGEDRWRTEPRSEPLRREPVFAAEPGAVRAPVDAHRQRGDARAQAAMDPNEQRLADMAAAFDALPRAGDAPEPGALYDGRPASWRPAVHPPRARRGAGLFWWLLLLALLAAAGWYAWQQGLLDPYIRQYNLPIQTSPTAT